MRSCPITRGFRQWRSMARTCLAEGVPPEEILWEEARNESLFAQGEAVSAGPREATRHSVPREFLRLAEQVAHHADHQRWGLLYSVLWRMTRGGDPLLLRKRTDHQVTRLLAMQKAIRRDIHKMHAFVRFRKVGETPPGGRDQFVAWFEPEHRIMPLTADFFRRRFAGMDWSIFTPTGSAHWNGTTLQLGPGVARIAPPDDRELEELWKTYYRSTFNPARIKVKAMQAEMPRKYWKNLPEAELIDDLIAQGPSRVRDMMSTEGRDVRPAPRNSYLSGLSTRNADPPPPPSTREVCRMGLDDQRAAAASCRACPLHRHATGTVHGDGPPDARIMVVGGAPEDDEDLTGRPFLGPAGQLLRHCLEEAGLQRDGIYLTYAVKHFKWRKEGRRRLPEDPTADEMGRCRPWLLAELHRVRPEVLICLGETAARSLLGPSFCMASRRGLVERPDLASRVIATVNPSSLVDQRSTAKAERERARLVADLRLAAS